MGTDTSKGYRERVGMPRWARPALGAVGALWVLRRTRKQARERSLWRAGVTLVGSTMTLLTAFRFLRSFGKVAVEVRGADVRVGLGPFERRIPAESVRDVRVVGYNPLVYLGWGYRVGLGGRRAFSQLGVRRGVEITSVEDGKQHRTFVSSNDPEALAGAISAAAGVESA
ncbi:MAG TPA: hypothetical protein VKV26_24545 [Dehalococcoidia bacterium]|nr:hypothetical protein [Dehalococcoidia bacterium]